MLRLRTLKRSNHKIILSIWVYNDFFLDLILNLEYLFVVSIFNFQDSLTIFAASGIFYAITAHEMSAFQKNRKISHSKDRLTSSLAKLEDFNICENIHMDSIIFNTRLKWRLSTLNQIFNFQKFDIVREGNFDCFVALETVFEWFEFISINTIAAD